MTTVLAKALSAIRGGGASALMDGATRFGLRRYHKAVARMRGSRALVELPDAPQSVVGGCMYKLVARVRNEGFAVWRQPEAPTPAFTVAARMVARDGLVLESQHMPLPKVVEPGATCAVELVLEVPMQPGPYQLQIDVVRENGYWFSELAQRSRWPQPKARPAGGGAIDIPVVVSPHNAQGLLRRWPTLDVTLDVTNKCPLKCIQCRKTYFERFDEQQDMDLALFRRIAAEVFPHARSVTLSSAGEPLMARGLFEAIAITQSHGVEITSFITSALHLTAARAERLVDLGLSRLEISIDGASASVYDRIRVGSSFKTVIRNIERLNEIKARKRRRLPWLRFNVVLMKSNIHELPDLIDLAARLGVEEVHAQHMVIFIDSLREEALVFDQERANRFIDMAKQRAQRYGIRFFHPAPFTRSVVPPGPVLPTANLHNSGEDLRLLSKLPFEDAARSRRASRLRRSRAADGRVWLEGAGTSFERKTHATLGAGIQPCTDPWRKLYVDWQGQVFPCCAWQEEPLGNLRSEAFEEIWHSPRYRQLRDSLVARNLGKSCAQCSVITGGDVNAERSYFFGSESLSP